MKSRNKKCFEHPRRQFLENVMREMQNNVPESLGLSLQQLADPNIEKAENISSFEDSLDQIAELVEDINYAILLEKIKGFPIIINLLQSRHSSLQKRACQVIGDVCQNNETCQRTMLDLGAMQRVLFILDKHKDNDCRVKALYALSCLTRDYKPAEKRFSELSGFCYLMRAIQANVPKLTIKAIFLINYFTDKTDEYKDTLLSMGFIEQLITVLFSEDVDNTLREYCSHSLLNLASSYTKALQECRRPEFEMIPQLKERKSFIQGKDEFQEEENDVTALLDLLEGQDDEDNLEER